MEFDFQNDEGVSLLYDILIKEEQTKTGSDNFTRQQLHGIDVKAINITAISQGKDFNHVNYMVESNEDSKIAPEINIDRLKLIYETTSKKESSKIKLMKDYFATGDLKPLQYYLDKL